MKKTIKINFNIKIKSHKKNIAFLLLVFVFLLILSNLPYFNIFLNLERLLLITITIGILLFLSSVSFILIAIIFMLVSCLALLIKKDNLAEQVGNVVYFILLIAFLKNFSIYLKEIRKRK